MIIDDWIFAATKVKMHKKQPKPATTCHVKRCPDRAPWVEGRCDRGDANEPSEISDYGWMQQE